MAKKKYYGNCHSHCTLSKRNYLDYAPAYSLNYNIIHCSTQTLQVPISIMRSVAVICLITKNTMARFFVHLLSRVLRDEIIILRSIILCIILCTVYTIILMQLTSYSDSSSVQITRDLNDLCEMISQQNLQHLSLQTKGRNK